MSDLQDADLSFLSGFKPKEVQLTNEDVNHPNVQSYLSYLNTYEGKPAENQTVGYKSFKDLSDHPKIQVAFNDKGDTSDAAGAYQILGKTWDAQKKKLGLKDFTLPNQQKAAVGILKDIGALDHIKNGDFDKANELAKDQWASLPGSKIGAATGQIPKVNPEAEAILQKAKQDYDPDVSFVSGFTPKQNVENLPPKKISDISAFSNNQPNQQNESITPTSTDVLKRFGKDFEKSVSGMSWEDFKKKSLIAPAATYTAASLGIPGFTEQEKQEAQQNLQQKLGVAFQGVKNVANMPVQDFSQGIVKAAKEIKEHPGTFAGSNLQSMAYDPEQVFLPQAISALGKPIVSTSGKVANAVREAAMAEPEIASQVNAIKARTSQAKEQLNQGFENLKNKFNEPEANVTGAPNVGAALTTKQSAVNAILPELSQETQAFVQSTPIDKINLPALQTKALEEKHGIKLSQGQRTEDTGRYAQEWNTRGKDTEIGDLFNDQAAQFRDALDNIKRKHTPNMGNAKGEDLAQIVMDSYSKNDAVHVKAIEDAYGGLKQRHNEMLAERGFPAESGMPLDTQGFVNHAKNNLHDNFNMTAAEKSGLMGDLARIEKNGMTLPEFIAFDKKLSRMQRSADAGESAAAGNIRNAFEQIPLKEGMEELMPMYQQAKGLARQRFEKLETIPGYKFAVEAQPNAEEIGKGIGSTGANKFYGKFIDNASTGDLKRIKAELANNPQAIKAIRAAELEKAVKSAGFTGDRGEFSPKRLNDYLETNSSNLVEKIGPEALNDLAEINVLGAKVAKPNAGVFNHSNSLSGFLGDMAKQGLQLKAEGALAGATHGASILPVQALKSASEFINKGKFAKETVHLHSGLVNKE